MIRISVVPFGAFILSCLQLSGATEYLLLIMAANNEGFVKEVGECTADQASFGRIVNGDEAIAGCFVTASPADACTTLTEAPTNASLQCVGGFFVVATRGNCSFAQKAYHAQTANYQGLIAYNSIGHNYPVSMGPDNEFGPHINIPSFMVGYDCGRAIITGFTYEKGFAFLIRMYWSYHDLLRYLVPFVVVVGICFFVMLAAMVVKCIGDRRRQMRRRLTKRHLKQIPTKKFIKGEDPETCPICLDDFEEDEKLRILPCGHAYHCRCVDPWLLKSRRVCPICKRKVLPGRDDSSDSEAEERTGAGTSGVTTSLERTPLLSSRDQERIMVGNSLIYGLYNGTRMSDNTTPPLNRGRPVILSPVSTPDGSFMTTSGGSQEHIMERSDSNTSRVQTEYETGHSSGQYTPPAGLVNPNFVDDPTVHHLNQDERVPFPEFSSKPVC